MNHILSHLKSWKLSSDRWSFCDVESFFTKKEGEENENKRINGI